MVIEGIGRWLRLAVVGGRSRIGDRRRPSGRVPGIGELNDARDCRTMDIDAITDARKAEILRLLDQGVDFDRPTRLFLAEKYSCSEVDRDNGASTCCSLTCNQGIFFRAAGKLLRDNRAPFGAVNLEILSIYIVFIEPIVSVLLGRRLNIEFLLSRRSQWVWAENKDVMNGAVFPRETDEKGASAVGLFVGFTARPPLRLCATVDGRRLACTPLNNIDYPSAAV